MRGKEFAMRLAAEVMWNQTLFLGKKKYWFQPMCETLGWELSDTFVDRFLIVLLVVCADPDLIDSTTKDLSSSWNNDQIRVKAAFASAVYKAVQKKTIRYKSAFKFFKTPFPSL